MKGKRFAQQLGITYAEYSAAVSDVKERLNTLNGTKISVIFSLSRFRAISSRADFKVFLRVCKKEFVLDKSEVSRMLRVVEIFGNEAKDGLEERWSAYSYTVLAEMLTLSKEDRERVLPTWTVKNVRDFKKLMSKDEKAAEAEEVEEPEDQFVRFKKFTRAQLCCEILRLEAEVEILRKERN